MGFAKGFFGIIIFLMMVITTFKELPSNDTVALSIAIIIAGAVAHSEKG